MVQDGTRVPLLSQGFRPTAAYVVSFVYLHAGSPFLKKGDMRMTLPKMDLPVESSSGSCSCPIVIARIGLLEA